MTVKTEYTWDVTEKFTPYGFTDEITHVATTWEVSRHPKFGTEGSDSEVDYRNHADPTALTKLSFYVEDYLQGFKDYWIRCKYHSSRSVVNPKKVTCFCECVKGSTEVTLLGVQNPNDPWDIQEVRDLEFSILRGMRIDLKNTYSGKTGGANHKEGTVVRSVDRETKKITLTNPSLYNGKFTFEFVECVESDWSTPWRFDTTRGSWATINIGNQPTPQSGNAGDCVTFTVGNITITDGTPLTYEWQLEGIIIDGEKFRKIENSTDPNAEPHISGADTNVLTVCNLRYPEDTGLCFRLKITAETAADVYSDTACITVNPVVINITQQPQSQTVQNSPVINDNTCPCIAVIDETSPSQAVFDSAWAQFRTAWPQRPFHLMSVARGNSWGYNKIPNNMSSYPNPLTEHRVPRWGGDWFSLANLSQYPQGSVIALFVDNSGSMTTSTVSQAISMIEQKCSAAGFTIIRVYVGNERYIDPFITSLVGPGATAGPVITIGADFSITAVTNPAGYTISYQWQISEDSGNTWYDVEGATSNTYTTPPAIFPGDNGDRYRCKLTAPGAEDVYSNPVLLTVTSTVGYSSFIKYKLEASSSWTDYDLDPNDNGGDNNQLDLIAPGVYDLKLENGSVPIRAWIWGAAGGASDSRNGGNGGYTTADMILVNSNTYKMVIGHPGKAAANGGDGGAAGNGGDGQLNDGGGGGGYSGLSLNSAAIIVAGGGGGSTDDGTGGAGGGIIGANSSNYATGGGGAIWDGPGKGNATAGLGDGNPGGTLQGGGGSNGGAGGGSGYRGGGGGVATGGGGGGCGYFNNSKVSSGSTDTRGTQNPQFNNLYGGGTTADGQSGRIKMRFIGEASPEVSYQTLIGSPTQSTFAGQGNTVMSYYKGGTLYSWNVPYVTPVERTLSPSIPSGCTGMDFLICGRGQTGSNGGTGVQGQGIDSIGGNGGKGSQLWYFSCRGTSMSISSLKIKADGRVELNGSFTDTNGTNRTISENFGGGATAAGADGGTAEATQTSTFEYGDDATDADIEQYMQPGKTNSASAYILFPELLITKGKGGICIVAPQGYQGDQHRPSGAGGGGGWNITSLDADLVTLPSPPTTVNKDPSANENTIMAAGPLQDQYAPTGFTGEGYGAGGGGGWGWTNYTSAEFIESSPPLLGQPGFVLVRYVKT